MVELFKRNFYVRHEYDMEIFTDLLSAARFAADWIETGEYVELFDDKGNYYEPEEIINPD